MNEYVGFAEAVGTVPAPVDAIFDFLDDQSNLSSHMSKSSGMMLGSTMDIHMDDKRARSVGSRFGFTGRILGIPLAVEEIVTGREPPGRKTWETTGEPRLWVIGRYRMGLELTQRGNASQLRVFIEYMPSPSGIPRLLSLVFGKTYARWCTRQMVTDAQKHFTWHVVPLITVL